MTDPTEEGEVEAKRSIVYTVCLKPKTNEKILEILNGAKMQVVITVMIFFALFGDDFRLAVCPKSADDTFQVITIFCLFVFAAELGVNFVCLPDWRFGEFLI